MIRVAHLSFGATPRGLEQMVLQLCKFRDRSRFDATVALPEEGVMATEMRLAGAKVYTHPAGFEQAAREADIVNVHWCVSDPVLLAIAERSGNPYVTTLHWLSVLPRLPAMTICTSRGAREIQGASARFVTIENGVDLDRFYPIFRALQNEIIITRVCHPTKCAPYFWDVISMILRRYPHVRVQIVGDTPPDARSTDRVQFLGVRRDIPEILQGSDIFFYTPYPWHGSRDLAPMEASACGLPSVISCVQATWDSVQNGVSGFLTPFGDVDACVLRLSQLIENHEMRARMGKEAARLARLHFDGRLMARKYELVYDAVLENAAVAS